MAWLAVDPWDNEEYIYDNKPVRNRYDNGWEDIQSVEGECYNHYVCLSKGTILKLIGRELTYKDEPVEI